MPRASALGVSRLDGDPRTGRRVVFFRELEVTLEITLSASPETQLVGIKGIEMHSGVTCI